MRKIKSFALFGSLLMLLTVVSGCTAIDTAGETSNQFFCEIGGGTWMENVAQCCPSGCPLEIPEEPSDALLERCEVCWG